MSFAVVKLFSVTVNDPNHVGQTGDWYYLSKVNGITINCNESKTIETIDEKIRLDLKVYEKDKVADCESLTKEYLYNEIKNRRIKLIVTVTENRGRFSGNSAKVEFIFDIK